MYRYQYLFHHNHMPYSAHGSVVTSNSINYHGYHLFMYRRQAIRQTNDRYSSFGHLATDLSEIFLKI